ncbi:ankyrin repeat-containing domain protein [Apiospora rasikravindrae]|uniref:Ankyrin repeat-containing domain protein n=1 Tax=Apiospora rasikravindrae TaxID=990691 RepID=A0ABR1TCK9_9PEZI
MIFMDRILHKTASRARTILLRGHKTFSDFESYVLNRVSELDTNEDEAYSTLVHDAVRHNKDLDIVLKTEVSSINNFDSEGLAPLHLACLHDNSNALKKLLHHGANVDATDRQGETPLHLAALRGQVTFASWLLDAGSNINRRNSHGDAALHKACRYPGLGQDNQIVEYLLGRGTNASMVNDYGDTVLHLLANQPAKSPSLERTFDALLRYGAWSVIDAQNHFGNTPLLKSLWEVNDTAARLLLRAGACGTITNGKKLNVLHAAARLGNHEVITCLRQAKLEGLDYRSKSTNGLAPIGELRRSIRGDQGGGAGMVKNRHPSTSEISSFEDLLREVRDRTIITENARLMEIILSIKDDNPMETCEALRGIIRMKKEAGILEEMIALDDVVSKVLNGSTQEAATKLEVFMAISNQRLASSTLDEEADGLLMSITKER